MSTRLLPLLLLVAVPACGTRARSDGGVTPGDGSAAGGLDISPRDAVLGVDGKSASTLVYTVTRNGKDVSAQAMLYLADGRIGGFAGNVFTSAAGGAGKTAVFAKLDNEMVETTLTVKVTQVVITQGAPPDAPMKFGGGEDPGFAPEVAYPPDNALVPPNLVELEFQWSPKAGRLFEIALAGDNIDLRIYVACAAAPCAYEPDETVWKFLSSAGRGRGVQVTLRGTSAEGGPVGSAPPRTLSFADEDMTGGLYYWAASAGGIYRYEFGLRRQKGEAYYTPGQAGAMCVGCHAMSRNGARMAAGMNIPGPAYMRAIEVASRKKLFEIGSGLGFPGSGGSNFEAFTADGSKLITVENNGLTVRNASTGAIVGKSPALDNANMPDVAPDSSQVVFARTAGNACPFGLCASNPGVSQASLFTSSFNGTTFGAPKQLVAAGNKNNYYPSYSPKGELVVFNRNAKDSYDAPDARVMVVNAAGGAALDLASANLVEGNSWPKWSPFIHHFNGATIYWITFSSRRDVGLHKLADANGRLAQLWMVPVDVARLQQGIDSAYPPIWLPFQDATTGNHIAQWVEKVERQPCSQIDQKDCMANEVCEMGRCIPKIQ